MLVSTTTDKRMPLGHLDVSSNIPPQITVSAKDVTLRKKAKHILVGFTSPGKKRKFSVSLDIGSVMRLLDDKQSPSTSLITITKKTPTTRNRHTTVFGPLSLPLREHYTDSTLIRSGVVPRAQAVMQACVAFLPFDVVFAVRDHVFRVTLVSTVSENQTVHFLTVNPETGDVLRLDQLYRDLWHLSTYAVRREKLVPACKPKANNKENLVPESSMHTFATLSQRKLPRMRGMPFLGQVFMCMHPMQDTHLSAQLTPPGSGGPRRVVCGMSMKYWFGAGVLVPRVDAQHPTQSAERFVNNVSPGGNYAYLQQTKRADATKKFQSSTIGYRAFGDKPQMFTHRCMGSENACGCRKRLIDAMGLDSKDRRVLRPTAQQLLRAVHTHIEADDILEKRPGIVRLVALLRDHGVRFHVDGTVLAPFPSPRRGYFVLSTEMQTALIDQGSTFEQVARKAVGVAYHVSWLTPKQVNKLAGLETRKFRHVSVGTPVSTDESVLESHSDEWGAPVDKELTEDSIKRCKRALEGFKDPSLWNDFHESDDNNDIEQFLFGPQFQGDMGVGIFDNPTHVDLANTTNMQTQEQDDVTSGQWVMQDL